MTVQVFRLLNCCSWGLFIDFTIIAKNQEYSVGGLEWEHHENICYLTGLHTQTSFPAGALVNRTVQGDAWPCMRDDLPKGYWNEVDQTLVFVHAVFSPSIKRELAVECSDKDFIATGHTLYSRHGENNCISAHSNVWLLKESILKGATSKGFLLQLSLKYSSCIWTVWSWCIYPQWEAVDKISSRQLKSAYTDCINFTQVELGMSIDMIWVNQYDMISGRRIFCGHIIIIH